MIWTIYLIVLFLSIRCSNASLPEGFKPLLKDEDCKCSYIKSTNIKTRIFNGSTLNDDDLPYVGSLFVTYSYHYDGRFVFLQCSIVRTN